MKIAILGVFYSGYKDVWVDFINLFNKFWPNCPYPFYIVSDCENEKYFMNCNLLSAGSNAEYSRKIQKAISEIDSDYYLLLLEDFFFEKPIDEEFVNNAIAFMSKNNISYYAMPMDEFKKNYKGKKIDKSRRMISKRAEYTVSCQPAFWERNFLKECIGNENYNAWVFEGIYCKSKYAHTKEFLERCVADVSNPLCLVHGILKGKIIPDAVKLINSSGYYLLNNRPKFSDKEYRKEKRKTSLKNALPYWLQRIIKKFYKRGSMIDSRSKEIERVMASMRLE